MFKYGVNCAFEEVSPRAPVILRGSMEQVAKEAAEIGYDGLELFIREPKQYDGQYLKRVADDYGLGFSCIGTGMEYTVNQLCLISDDASIRQRAVERLKEHIDLAAEIKSMVVVGMVRGNVPDFAHYDRYEGYLVEALYALSEHATKAGVGLVVEAILRYISNYLNSVPETVDFLERLGLQNVGLHIDSHLMNMEDKDIAASVRYGRDWLKYVHFSDSNRAYPGGGNFDFKRMMNALMDIGYTGYITTECQPFPDSYTCAKRGFDYCRHLQGLLEIERAPLKSV